MVGTYVKDGNSCIGCSLIEEFPDDYIGCRNLKSQTDLIHLASDFKVENKLMLDKLKFVVECGGVLLEGQLYDEIISVIEKIEGNR